jgi:hypothetical protein
MPLGRLWEDCNRARKSAQKRTRADCSSERGIGNAARKVQDSFMATLTRNQIDAQRRVLVRKYREVRDVVFTLTELAKTKKYDPNHGVHLKLRKAQKTLEERKSRLDKFNSEHPVPND